MNKKWIVGAVILLSLIGISLYKLQSRAPAGITASGTIEVTRADITPKTSGYLSQLTIEPGDQVTLNQPITIISRPDLSAAVTASQAALEKSAAQLQDLQKGAREQELKEAEASLRSAQSLYTQSIIDLSRSETLYSQNAIAKQTLDNAKSSADVARQSFLAAQARLDLLAEGTRPDIIESARLEVERSKALLAQSQSLLADTTVVSPLSGIILTKNYENGEYVSAGAPIATVANMSDCWVRIYIPSNQLGLIQVGQSAEITVDSFPGRKFHGQVKEISPNSEFTPRQSLSQNERANMVFRVKVKVDNESGTLKPGMPADVVLQ